MPTVTSHLLDPESARAGLRSAQARLAESARLARTSVAHLAAVRESALACAGYLAALEPDGADLSRALRLGAQAAAATFALAARTYGRLEVPLGPGAPLTHAATGPTPAAHARAWREGFLLAAVSRDRRSLGALAKTPAGLLTRTSDGQEYLPRYAVLLQGLWAHAPDVPQRLVAVLEATAAGRISGAAEDYALNIIVAEVELLYRFLIDDRDAFAASLVWALERHRAYFSTPGRVTDPAGYLALGPAAVCAFAHEAGWPITVTSPYLPPRLISGELPTP